MLAQVRHLTTAGCKDRATYLEINLGDQLNPQNYRRSLFLSSLRIAR